jgi:hypothetical protein
MTAFNALMDTGYGPVAPAPAPPPAQGSVQSPIGPHIADMQGMRPLTGDHNIPLHVGFLGLLALTVVVFLRLIGFRFAVAGRIGTGA